MKCINQRKWMGDCTASKGGGGVGLSQLEKGLRGSEHSLSWAGTLRWDGGMSHMLSMSCLCVYQSRGCMKMLWVIAIWATL